MLTRQKVEQMNKMRNIKREEAVRQTPNAEAGLNSLTPEPRLRLKEKRPGASRSDNVTVDLDKVSWYCFSS